MKRTALFAILGVILMVGVGLIFTGLGSDGPPESTLTYDERSISSQAISYCRIGGGGGECVDGAIEIPKQEDLRVPEGARLNFNYGGRWATEIEVSALPIRADDRVDYPGGSTPVKSNKDGSEAQVPVELVPGEYLLDVFVRFFGGDAYYSYRIAITRE